MTSVELQRVIVKHLRANPAGLDPQPLAALMDQAEFRVRAELRVMRRHGLVRGIPGPGDHRWYLTAHGYAEAYTADYLEEASA